MRAISLVYVTRKLMFYGTPGVPGCLDQPRKGRGGPLRLPARYKAKFAVREGEIPGLGLLGLQKDGTFRERGCGARESRMTCHRAAF